MAKPNYTAPSDVLVAIVNRSPFVGIIKRQRHVEIRQASLHPCPVRRGFKASKLSSVLAAGSVNISARRGRDRRRPTPLVAAPTVATSTVIAAATRGCARYVQLPRPLRLRRRRRGARAGSSSVAWSSGT